MTAPPKFDIEWVYKGWVNAATTLLAYQWKLFDAQYETGLKMMEAALGVDPPDKPANEPPPMDVVQLQRRAVECISQGLAPPKEIYQAPFRGRIDWGKLPEWARPSDPELFDGRGHEG
jgi:hypothetical protein